MLINIVPIAKIQDRIEQSIKASVEHDCSCAVVLVKIHNFKDINQQFGYRAGEQALLFTQRNLEDIARNKSCLSRVGIDTFCVTLPYLKNSELLELANQKIIQNLNSTYDIDGDNVFVGVHLGSTVADKLPDSVEKFLLLAESALQQVNNHTEHYCQLAYESIESPTGFKESELRASIDNGEMELFFQPKINLRTAELSNFEALIRWHRNDHYIAPYEFLPCAERNGFIRQITPWVLNNSLRVLSELSAEGETCGVSINLSQANIQEPDLAATIARALSIWGVEPSRLTLEITELSLHKSLDKMRDFCRDMNTNHGYKISIDDFGTGYSSFDFFYDSYANELKIDRSFITGIKSSPKKKSIVTAMVMLARDAGIKTVAEGIETLDDLTQAISLGIDYGQGYFIAKPIPEKYLRTFLKLQRRGIRGLLKTLTKLEANNKVGCAES